MGSKVVYLEEKLQHQMGELNAIESNHQKTKVKLREIIQQAESDISKANNEKEMVSERLSSLEEKLFDAEQKLASSANDQKCLHAQMRQIKDENAQLRKSLNLNSNNNNNNNFSRLSELLPLWHHFPFQSFPKLHAVKRYDVINNVKCFLFLAYIARSSLGRRQHFLCFDDVITFVVNVFHCLSLFKTSANIFIRVHEVT